LKRYVDESARLLGVLDQRLSSRAYIMGEEYSIADISILGWVRNLVGFYGAGDLVGYERFTHVQRWLAECLKRPAVERGLNMPPR
jgi:GST-like protein